MTRFFKKTISTAVVAAMSLSMISANAVNAFAESEDFQMLSNEFELEDCATIDMDEYQEYLDTLSDEELNLIDEKEEVLSLVSSEPIMARSSSVSQVPGTFTIYQQETNTYCVPACIKSLLMYVNDSSPTQASIDSVINRSFTAIPDYVNSRQDECRYVVSTQTSSSGIASRVKSDITTWEVPTFLRISGTNGNNWYYSTNGHCILSYAIYDDLSKLKIADPLGNRVSGCPYFYEKTSSNMSNFTTHLCW